MKLRKSLWICLVCGIAVMLAGPVFAEGGSEATGAGDSETLTVTLALGTGAPEKEGLPLQAYLEEKFNFKFNLVEYDSKERERQLSMMFASNEIPDILRTDFVRMVQWYEKGIIRSIPKDLLNKNMPNFVKWTNELDPRLWNYTQIKGVQVGITNTNANGGYSIPIMWNTAMLDEIGYSKAPETIQEWEDALKKIADERDISPISAPGYQSDLTRIGNWFAPIFGAYGCSPGLWVKKDNGKVVYFFEDPGYIQAVKLLNSWYEDGLIDQEWVTTPSSDRTGTTEDLYVKFAREKLALLYSESHIEYRPWEWYDNEIMALEAAEESARWQAYHDDWESTKALEVWTAGPPPKGPLGQGTFLTVPYSGALVFGSQSDDAKLARLLNYLEVAATDPEVYVSMMAGGPSDRDFNTDELDWPGSPTGKTYHWSENIINMDAGKMAKDDHHYRAWGLGYFSPWVHWHPNIKYIWYGDVLTDRDKLAQSIGKYPGYLNAFVIPLPSETEYPDLVRVVQEFTMKAINGSFGDLDAEYSKVLATWKKNGGDVLAKEANDLYGG